MIDLASIPEETRLARGDLSTIRAALKDKMKALQILCGQHSSYGPQILRQVQPDKGCAPESIDALVADARNTLVEIEECAAEIEIYTSQAEALKPKAWGK